MQHSTSNRELSTPIPLTIPSQYLTTRQQVASYIGAAVILLRRENSLDGDALADALRKLVPAVERTV